MSTAVTSATGTGSSGTYYVAGLSGLDTSALIKAAVAAKMQPAYNIDAKLKNLDTNSAAWGDMRDLLGAMSKSLANLASSADDADYAFDKLTSYLTTTLSDATHYLGVTVSEKATIGTYDIVVNQIAATQKVSSAAQTADSALGYAGTFTLQADGHAGADISVTADMTLSDIASAINGVSGDTGISATLVTSGAGQQTLVLTSVDTGLTASGDQPMTVTDTDGVLEALGLVDNTGAFTNQLRAARNAELTIDGIAIESTSNEIENLINGVSINLYAATEGQTISLEVDQDLSSALKDIKTFVEAYNAYRTWALTMQATDANGATKDAVLFGESNLRSANAAIYAALATTVEVDGHAWSLASIGIALGDDNMLKIDEGALEKALLQNPKAVEALFSTSVSSSAGKDVGIVKMPGSMPGGTYMLDVEVDGAGKITSATLNGVALEVSGTTLKGGKGTEFEGLYMYYSGGVSVDDLEITINQGLADAVVRTVDTYTNYSNGLITTELKSNNDEYESLEKKRKNIEKKAGEYEERMIQYYSKLEAKIAAAKTQLAYIEALLSKKDD